MSRKLHKFQTEAEYQAYSASTAYTTPCVALIVDTNVIYYDYGNNKPQVDLSDYKVESQETSVGGDKYGKSAITKIHYIARGTTSMNGAFSSYSSLEDVTCEIPSSVENMSNTFRDCSSLVTAPDIPSGVKVIGMTFNGCRSIKEVTFLPTTPPPYFNTLTYCDSLETIYVPDSALDAYKTASGWSQFADKFKPLSSKQSE